VGGGKDGEESWNPTEQDETRHTGIGDGGDLLKNRPTKGVNLVPSDKLKGWGGMLYRAGKYTGSLPQGKLVYGVHEEPGQRKTTEGKEVLRTSAEGPPNRLFLETAKLGHLKTGFSRIQTRKVVVRTKT